MTVPPRSLTAQQFKSRLRNAKRGEKITYYIGLLMRDRQKASLREGYEEVNDTGVAAYRAYESKKVHLVQKRAMPFLFEYMAVVR